MPNVIEILMKEVGAEKAAGSFGKVTKNIKGVSIAAAKYTAVSGVMLAGALKLVDAHAVQARAEAQLELALGKTSKALLNQATALQRVTRFGDESIIGVQASIGAFIKDEAQIKLATKATLDFAAATGMDLKSAGDVIAKTLGSSTNALTRYGIEVEGAVGSTERLATLTENINKLYGGSAEKAAEATAGIDQLRMTMGDLAEVAGSKLAPILNTVGLALANILQGAPGKEWWEGVAIGMDNAASAQQKLSIQAGGIDRLIKGYDHLGLLLGQEGLITVFQSLGLEYDTMSTRQENLNFLQGMSEVVIRQIVQARAEETVAAQEAKAAAEALVIVYETMGLRMGTVNNAQKELIKLSKQGETQFNAVAAPVKNLTSNFQKFEAGSAAAFGAAGNAATAASEIIAAAAGDDKERQILGMRIAQIAALINTAQGVTKALAASAPPFNFINAAAVGAAGALQVSAIQGAINQARSAATGLDEVFDRPTLIEVGDTRQGERVQIGPDGGDAAGMGSINITINSPITYPGFTRDVIIPEIREALRLGI